MRTQIISTLLVLSTFGGGAPPLAAQSEARSAAYATRAQLESVATICARRAAEARDASDRAASLDEEKDLRARLRNGDFRVGDRIVLRISGGATALDTLSVTPERGLAIPDAGDVPLDGVLRSELQDHLNAQVSRYLRNAVVRAEPLTRLAVLGEVRAPGFVHVPGRALLSDVISAAGGPLATGSLERVSVRRAGQVVVSSGAFAKALSDGVTVDDLNLRGGDEVLVEPKRAFHWTQLLQTTAIVIGSAATIIAIQHR